MNVKPALKETLPLVKFWHKVDGGFAPTFSWFDTAKEASCIYTEDDFREIDHRLVDMLNNCADGPVVGPYLTNALECWAVPRLVLPKRDSVSGRIIGEHLVKRFEEFSWSPSRADVTVRFLRIGMAAGNTGVEYPATSQPFQVEVPKYWLDEHYPEWETRYTLAKSLELDTDALTKYLIEPIRELPEVSLPNLEA